MSAFHADTIAAVQQSLATTVKNIETARTARDKHAEAAREAAREFEASLVREADLRKLLRHMDPKNAEQYADPQPREDSSRRGLFLDGLRTLIDYYEQNPEIPTPGSARLHIFAPRSLKTGGAEAEEAYVAQIAAVMGLKAERTAPNHHFEATLEFNEAVEVCVVSTERTLCDWEEGDPYPDWWLSEQSAAAEPESQQCVASTLSGAHCQLDAGHGGNHQDGEIYWVPRMCGATKVGDASRATCVRPEGHWNPLQAGYDFATSAHFSGTLGEWEHTDGQSCGEVQDERMVSMGTLGEVQA